MISNIPTQQHVNDIPFTVYLPGITETLNMHDEGEVFGIIPQTKGITLVARVWSTK